MLDHMGRRHKVCRRRPQDVGGGRPLVLHIGQYGDVLRTLLWDVLGTPYFNVLRMLVEDLLMDVGTGLLLALHRGPYGNVRRTSSREVLGT